MTRKSSFCTLGLSEPFTERGGGGGVRTRAKGPAAGRLAAAFACLQKIEADRILDGDPSLGKSLEQRVIWRELLDLELQTLDEQIELISSAAERLARLAEQAAHD